MSKTELIDVSMPGADCDIFVGRGRVKHHDEKYWYSHTLSAPYKPHKGNEDWREDAKIDYSAFLSHRINRADLEKLIGKKIGVWGDWGMELGKLLLKAVNKLESENGTQET